MRINSTYTVSYHNLRLPGIHVRENTRLCFWNKTWNKA